MEKSEAIATLRAHLDGGGWLHPVTLSEETVRGILDLLRETPDVVRCGERRCDSRCELAGYVENAPTVEVMPLLKPCPFCGGEAKLEDMGWPHHVFCKRCGAKTTSAKFGIDGEQEAIENWNRRVKDDD